MTAHDASTSDLMTPEELRRDSATRDELKCQLATLNCHFIWNLDAEGAVAQMRHHQLEAQHLGDIEGNLEVRSKVYLYLSFVFALPDETGARDFAKAEEYARKVIPENPTQAEVYVAKANLANIYYLDGKLEECRQMLDEARQIDVTSLQAIVAILLVEICTIAKLVYSGFQRGTDLCRQAIDLDPTSGEAHFALGQLLGRIRRSKDLEQRACDEEREAFRNAIRYLPDNARPSVYYTHCLSADLYFETMDDKHNKTVVEMERHLDNAMTLAQQNDDAKSLSWCSKTYKKLAQGMLIHEQQLRSNFFAERAREAIECAVKLLPNDVNILHEASSCFWQSVPHIKDYALAEYYLERATDRALQTRPHIWASIDLIRMRCARADETGQPMTPSALQQFQELLPKFRDFKENKFIHIEIIKQQLRQQEFDQAKDDLRDLLRMIQEIGDGSAKHFAVDLNYFRRKTVPWLFRENKRDYVRVLLTLLEMFLMFDPPYYFYARGTCLDIKHLYPSHSAVNRMLRDLDRDRQPSSFNWLLMDSLLD